MSWCLITNEFWWDNDTEGMERIQFDTEVEKPGILRIPEKYARTLKEGERVRVTVSEEEIRETDTVKFLRENPLHAPGFKPMKREDLYDRQ